MQKLIQKCIEVSKIVGAIGKTKEVKGYSVRETINIMDKCYDAMQKHGLMIRYEVKAYNVNTVANDKGGYMTTADVFLAGHITDGEESLTVEAVAFMINSGDKALQAAQTRAKGEIISSAFLIPYTDKYKEKPQPALKAATEKLGLQITDETQIIELKALAKKIGIELKEDLKQADAFAAAFSDTIKKGIKCLLPKVEALPDTNQKKNAMLDFFKNENQVTIKTLLRVCENVGL